MTDSIKCEHREFNTTVSVARVTDGERGPVTAYVTHLKIHCKDCHVPFQFMGLEMGLDLRGATMDVDGQEAHLAIAPVGSVPHPLDGHLVRGFRVRSPGKDH